MFIYNFIIHKLKKKLLKDHIENIKEFLGWTVPEPIEQLSLFKKLLEQLEVQV